VCDSDDADCVCQFVMACGRVLSSLRRMTSGNGRLSWNPPFWDPFGAERRVQGDFQASA
jgi:hypothetical protein